MHQTGWTALVADLILDPPRLHRNATALLAASLGLSALSSD
jgi:hypothetical protein